MTLAKDNVPKVLMFGPVPPPFGGIASVLQDIVESSLNREFAFHVLGRPETYPPFMSSLPGRTVVRIMRLSKFFLKLLVSRYCIAHMHSSTATMPKSTFYMSLCRISKTPILLHLHGTDWDYFYTRHSKQTKNILHKALEMPHTIVVLYEEWVEKLRDLGVTCNILAIPNFIPDVPPPDEHALQEAKSLLNIPENALLVGCIGMIGKRKGHFDIMDAIPSVLKENPNVYFLHLGSSEIRGELERLREKAAAAGIDAHVRIPGEIRRDLVPAVLGNLDIFLLPSHMEGMPISILEAMRARKPIITTTVGGIPEMIEHERSGLLIEPGRPDEIAAAVLKLAGDASLRDSLAQGAHERFLSHFETEQCVGQMRDVYSDIMSSRRRGAPLHE